MSRTQITTDLALRLITSITGIDTQSDPENFALCRDFTLKTFRNNTFLSVDKFAIDERLRGIEEKFRVLNNEPLGDELSSLLSELESSGAPLQPEALMLLLELSSNPIPRADEILVELETVRQAAAEAAEKEETFITWKDGKGDSSEEDDEDIWQPVDFGADTSESDWDDDDGAIFAKISGERKPRQRTFEIEPDAEDDLAKEVEKYVNFVNRKPMDDLVKSQYWSTKVDLSSKEQNEPVLVGLSNEEKSNYWVVTELQVVREVIFHLNGLQSSIFTIADDGKVTVNSRYVLRHTSAEGFAAMLDWFGREGAHVFNIRKIIELYNNGSSQSDRNRRKDWPASMQALIAGIEESLTSWQMDTLVPLEEKFVIRKEAEQGDVSASLLGLQDMLEPSLRRVRILSQLATELLEVGLSGDKGISFLHLEVLYKKACELQLVGDVEEYQFVARIFFPVLNTYLRPVIRWMRNGELGTQDGNETVFIECKNAAALEQENVAENWLRDLWHDQYVLNRDKAGKVLAPRFLAVHSQKILVTGKSVLFLQRLRKDGTSSIMSNLHTVPSLKLTFESVCGEDTSLSPFDELLYSALSKWLDIAHRDVSDDLRNVLCDDCGLWDSLDALTNLYFMRDGWAMTSFSVALFEKIARSRDDWDDRFLLTELMQSTYMDNPYVDITRASIRSSRQGSLAQSQLKRRSLKAHFTNALILDYRLSWPVMNVINVASLKAYQGVWSFLLMIRRATSGLEKLRIRKIGEESGSITSTHFYNLRWKLMICLNALHRYLTDLVLSPESEAIKKSLLGAEDVDSMVKFHAKHIDRVRDLCLLGSRLSTFHETIISILDLALLFTDICHSSIDGSMPEYLSREGRARRRARRQRMKNDGADSDDESSSGSEVDVEKTHGNGEEEEEEEETPISESETEKRASDHDDEFEEGDSTLLPIGSESQSHEDIIKSISKRFDELHSFLVAGLRSMARGGLYPEMLDILADFLETASSPSAGLSTLHG